MKLIFMCFLLMCMSGRGLCQQSHAVQWDEYERLLRKSSRQEAAGLVLTLGGGAALGLTVVLNLGDSRPVLGSPAATSRHRAIAPLLMSGVALAGGLVLVAASDRNRDRARRVRYSLKMDHTNQLHAYTVSSYYCLCLLITIKL